MFDEEIEAIEYEKCWKDDSTIEDGEVCQNAYLAVSPILEKAFEKEMIVFDELECRKEHDDIANEQYTDGKGKPAIVDSLQLILQCHDDKERQYDIGSERDYSCVCDLWEIHTRVLWGRRRNILKRMTRKVTRAKTLSAVTGMPMRFA